MALEIEHKYLVDHDLFVSEILNHPEKIQETQQISQGYLFSNSKKIVRIRKSNDRAFLTVKGSVNKTTRLEYEYEIPLSDASEMIDQLCDQTIEKTRYLVPHESFVWEVDIFHGANKGLIIAEIELEEEKTIYSRPEWALKNVTEDPKYLNAVLLEKPFNTWEK